jgi:hypothetical protein
LVLEVLEAEEMLQHLEIIMQEMVHQEQLILAVAAVVVLRYKLADFTAE